MNRVVVEVDKIRSYQTLVYKNGKRAFRKEAYNDYIKEIAYQINLLRPIDRGVSVKLTLHFKNKNKVLGDIDNITKPIQDILQLTGKIHDDKQIVHLDARKSTGYKKTTIEIMLEERL